MGVGLRLSGAAAAELARAGACSQRFIGFLAATASSTSSPSTPFPTAPFTDARQGAGLRARLARARAARVHQPLRRHPRRAPARRQNGSISTVPGAFKAKVTSAADVARMAERWSGTRRTSTRSRTDRQDDRARARARALLLPGDDRGGDRLLRARTCFRSSAVELMTRLTRPVGGRGGSRAAAPSRTVLRCLSRGRASSRISARASTASSAAGITIAKLQLSSALKRRPRRRRRPSACSRPSTTASICIRRSSARPARSRATPTCPTPSPRLRRGEAGGEWRVHCHVPVFLERFEGLGSTQDVAQGRARALPRARGVAASGDRDLHLERAAARAPKRRSERRYRQRGPMGALATRRLIGLEDGAQARARLQPADGVVAT